MVKEQSNSELSTSSMKKNAAILEHIEQVVTDIERILEQPETPERRIYLKGVLFYWLGILFEDGAVDTANLKVALEASRKLTERLKHSNEILKEKVRKELKTEEEI